MRKASLYYNESLTLKERRSYTSNNAQLQARALQLMSEYGNKLVLNLDIVYRKVHVR